MTITTEFTILDPVFTTLVNDDLWTTTEVTAAVNLIAADPLLASQLFDLNEKNWLVLYQPALVAGSPSVTEAGYYNGTPTGTIALASVSNVATLLGYHIL